MWTFFDVVGWFVLRLVLESHCIHTEHRPIQSLWWIGKVSFVKSRFLNWSSSRGRFRSESLFLIHRVSYSLRNEHLDDPPVLSFGLDMRNAFYFNLVMDALVV